MVARWLDSPELLLTTTLGPATSARVAMLRRQREELRTDPSPSEARDIAVALTTFTRSEELALPALLKVDCSPFASRS
jgi:hypothetical protein